MMKMNKKGFTIVELVIVIAVIAILAAVMIPTFSGIVDKANDSAASQQFMAAYKEGLATALADDGVIGDAANTTETVEVGDDFVIVFNGDFSATVYVGTFKTVEGTKTFVASTLKDYAGAVINAEGEVELKETLSYAS